MDSAFSIKLLLEKQREFNLNTHLAFIDYTKAFDMIKRPKLFEILQNRNIPNILLQNICEIYENNTIQLNFNNVTSEYRSINQGVRQGCPLSPTLFNIYIDDILHHWQEAYTLGIQIPNNIKFNTMLKYRFGDSQKLRLVRILRSTVMVRVGGGWVALDEFLVKNDPCRAKGRTNVELREQFVLADGVSQSMTPFKSKPSSNSSQSSQSVTPSFARTGSPSAGPITKVRERSERSAPMRKHRTSGPADSSSDISGPSFSESDSFRSHRLTPSTPSSQRGPGSRPSSRPNSRPPSRAGSDLSAENLEARKSSRQRVPSAGNSSSYPSSGVKGASTPSRIPSARFESSRGRPK